MLHYVGNSGLCHNLQQNFVFDNPYFVAKASEAAMLMDAPVQIAALRQAHDEVVVARGGKRFSAEDFQNKICKPLTFAAKWIQTKEKKYGAVATTNPAWNKLSAAMVESADMRRKILLCLAANRKLEDAEGITECNVLIAEFDKHLSGTRAATPAPAPPAEKPDPDAEVHLAEEAAAAADGGVEEESNHEIDPKEAMAQVRAEVALGKFHIHESAEACRGALEMVAQAVDEEHVWAVVIDAGPATQDIASRCVQTVREILPATAKRVIVTVLCGPNV